MLINTLTLMAVLGFSPMQDVPVPAEAMPSQDVAANQDTPPPAPQPIPEIMDNELILGEADAPATLVVYSSLVCTQCAAWHIEGLPRVIAAQIAEGELRLVTRFVPTEPDQLSAVASGIVRCAVKDNQMNVAGALFENLPALFDGTMDAMNWQLAGVAASGRTREEIVACLQAPETMQAVRDDSEAAAAAGLVGVPTFFLNGEVMTIVTAESIAAATAAALPTPETVP